MSLINDALKRASQSEKNRPRESSPAPFMQPTREARRSGLPIGIIVCVVLLLAASGWLVYRYFVPHQAAVPPPSRSAVVPVAAPAPPPKAEQAPAPAPVIVTAPPAKTNPPVAPVVPVVVVTPPPPPPFPELKLQSIFYSRSNPTIIINGESRGENEKIGEVRIAKIYPDKVTVEWQGQTKDLRMGNQ